MAEDVKIEDIVTEDIVVEEPKTAEVVKTDKTFTQEQLNKAVTERVSREKANTKKLQEQFDSEKESYVSQIEGMEKILSKSVEEMKKDLPDNYKKIVNKLSILEQYEFLIDPTNKVTKKTIPSTPEQTGDDKKPVKKITKLMF